MPAAASSPLRTIFPLGVGLGTPANGSGIVAVAFPSIVAFRAWSRSQPVFATQLAQYAKSLPSETRQVNEANRSEASGDLELQSLTYEELLAGNMTHYGAPRLMDKVMAPLREQMQKAKLESALKKPKLEFNDRGMGAFVFDRAAQQLSYLYEYYSPSQRRLVEPDEVDKHPNEGEGPDRFYLLADGSEVERRVGTQENGLPRVRTEAKKVFAHFENKANSNVSVELYITAGNFGSVEGKDFLISALAPLLLAELLEKAGIKVKITVFAGWVLGPSSAAPDMRHLTKFSQREAVLSAYQAQWNMRRHPWYGAFITAKNYNEPLDRDAVALLACDPRFWRTEGFAVVNAICKTQFNKEESSHGPTGNELYAALSMTDPPGSQAVRFCFGRNRSFATIADDVRDALEEVKRQLANVKGNQQDTALSF